MKTGIYRHYKGKEYLVLGVARHSETQEYLVVYVPLYHIPNNDGVQMSVRPLEMFNETLPDGTPRFLYLGTEEIAAPDNGGGNG